MKISGAVVAEVIASHLAHISWQSDCKYILQQNQRLECSAISSISVIVLGPVAAKVLSGNSEHRWRVGRRGDPLTSGAKYIIAIRMRVHPATEPAHGMFCNCGHICNCTRTSCCQSFKWQLHNSEHWWCTTQNIGGVVLTARGDCHTITAYTMAARMRVHPATEPAHGMFCVFSHIQTSTRISCCRSFKCQLEKSVAGWLQRWLSHRCNSQN